MGALVVAVVGTQIVTARRIDNRYVRLNGVCKAYLDELSSRLGAGIASSLDDRDRARLDRELAELD